MPGDYHLRTIAILLAVGVAIGAQAQARTVDSAGLAVAVAARLQAEQANGAIAFMPVEPAQRSAWTARVAAAFRAQDSALIALVVTPYTPRVQLHEPRFSADTASVAVSVGRCRGGTRLVYSAYAWTMVFVRRGDRWEAGPSRPGVDLDGYNCPY
jgi:hypothetical protein